MMQLSGMNYMDILLMPVDNMSQYIDWKLKYDSDVAKAKQKAFEEMKSKTKYKIKKR